MRSISWMHPKFVSPLSSASPSPEPVPPLPETASGQAAGVAPSASGENEMKRRLRSHFKKQGIKRQEESLPAAMRRKRKRETSIEERDEQSTKQGPASQKSGSAPPDSLQLSGSLNQSGLSNTAISPTPESAPTKQPLHGTPDDIRSNAANSPSRDQAGKPTTKKRRLDVLPYEPGAGSPTMEARLRHELQENQDDDKGEVRSTYNFDVPDASEADAVTEDGEDIELPPLSDMNPLLAKYMETIGLSEDDLVAAEICYGAHDSDPAFVMALEHLAPLLDQCLPPGFNKINVRIANQMYPEAITRIEEKGQNYVDIYIRINAGTKESVDKVAGRILGNNLHEFWAHAFDYLTTAYLRQEHSIDLGFLQEDEEHHHLLTPQFANVAMTMRQLVSVQEMRESFWKCIRGDVKHHIEHLGDLSETVENWATDYFDIDLEVDISSKEDSAKSPSEIHDQQ